MEYLHALNIGGPILKIIASDGHAWEIVVHVPIKVYCIVLILLKAF